MLANEKPIVHGITKLIQGNEVSYSQIPDGNDQSKKITSKHGGPVMSFTFKTTNPNAKKVYVNRVEHDSNGKDVEVSLFNESGTPVDAVVIGWEVPLT